MFRGADLKTRHANISFINGRIWQQLAFFKGCNLPRELADNIRMLVEPEDRFTLLHHYRYIQLNSADIINLLETLNFQAGPNQFSIQYLALVKDRVDLSDRERIKALVLPDDQHKVDRILMAAKSMPCNELTSKC